MAAELFVDTAGWGCFVDAKHPLHAKADTVISTARKSQRILVTTNYIVNELSVLLKSRLHLRHEQVVAFIDFLYADPQSNVIHIDRPTHEDAWRLYVQHQDKEWSLVDTSSFIVMRQRNIQEALTTDQHFAQASFTRVPLGQ